MAEIVDRQKLSIPIRPHVAAEMDVPFPMTCGDWDQMMAVMEAMRPGIVRDGEMPALLSGSTRA